MSLSHDDNREITSLLDKLDSAVSITDIVKKPTNLVEAPNLVAEYTSRELLIPDETNHNWILRKAPLDEVFNLIPIQTLSSKPNFVESYTKDDLRRLQLELQDFLREYSEDFKHPTHEHHISQIFLATVSQNDFAAIYGFHNAIISALRLSDLTNYLANTKPQQLLRLQPSDRYQYIVDTIVIQSKRTKFLTPTDIGRARTAAIRFVKSTHRPQSFTIDSQTGLYFPDQHSLELLRHIEANYGTLSDFQIEDYWDHINIGTFYSLSKALRTTVGLVKQQVLEAVRNAYAQRLISNAQLGILLRT